MARNKKTSDETAGAALVGTEEFRGALGGANYKWTPAQFATYMGIPGTWTPVLGDGTNNFTLTTAVGYYIKIGKLVFVSWYCVWSSIGSVGASQLKLSGFPFTSQNTGNERFPAAFGSMAGFDFTATLNPIIAQIGGGQSSISFSRVNDNAAVTALPSNGCSATGEVSGSCFYISA